MQDGGTAPLEQGTEFVGTAGRRHADGESREGAVFVSVWSLQFLVHQLSSRCRFIPHRSVPVVHPPYISGRPSLSTARDRLGSA